MIKFLMMATLVVGMGSVTTQGAYAKGGSFLGQPSDLFDRIGVSSSKSRKKAKEASSSHDRKRFKRSKR